MDSDSDDEFIHALDTLGGHAVVQLCCFCDTAGATIKCSMCGIAVYCDSNCLRKDFKSHRATCIKETQQQQTSDDAADEDYSDETESESDNDEDPAFMVKGRTRSNANNPGIRRQAPGLTEDELKTLIKLSSQMKNVDKQSEAIERLQQQIASLKADPSMGKGGLQKQGSFRKKELRALQEKLNELEQRADSGIFGGGAMGGMRGSFTGFQSAIYKPLLVKNDEAFSKYFKLKAMDMSIDQIKVKMQRDGCDPNLLDHPDQVSPNDPGPPHGSYVPLTVANDPAFKKYFKLKNMNMPIDQIKMKMEVDGVNPSLLDLPGEISPNDPGPPMFTSQPSLSLPTIPYKVLLVKDDPAFSKYFKLKQMGMPDNQIKLKMGMDGVKPELLDQPDEVSPNDPGPMSQDATSTMPMNGGGFPAGMNLQQLFSMVMQHQQMIQQGGLVLNNGGNVSGPTGGAVLHPVSVEDQMARELAAAETAVDDLFGDETTISSGGLTMVQQLEKKARKEANILIVENSERINELISELLNKKLKHETEAVEFYHSMSKQLDSFGLSLGTDCNQTWSARLLIKNKETSDWYFTEQQRLDAGKAYIRLWALSSLSSYVTQLQGKENQIINAESLLKDSVKGKVELIDRFTQLLKDSVKLKHKIFKSREYSAEVARMNEYQIPQSLEEHGKSLLESSSHLANGAISLAIADIESFEKLERGKKLRAHVVVHVGEKAIQLVGIVKKLGATSVPLDELEVVKSKVALIKEEYLSSQGGEEDEDDVL